MSPSPIIPDSVDTLVEVAQVLSARTAQVRLPNGREVFAYLGETVAEEGLQAGQPWRARLFVADFSRAELLAKEPATQIDRSI